MSYHPSVLIGTVVAWATEVPNASPLREVDRSLLYSRGSTADPRRLRITGRCVWLERNSNCK